MPGDRRKSVERHLSTDELDAAIDDAQETGKPRRVRRLCLIRNLYEGDSLKEAGRRVGVSRPTAGRWLDRWNGDGIRGLDPKFGGGRPPKLDDDEREQLQAVLKADQPWTKREVNALLEEAFDVTYSDRQLRRLLNSFGMNFAKPRPKAPERPDDAEAILDDRLQTAIDELRDDEPAPDGGYVVGFLDEAWPQPTENRQRLWAFGTPTIEKATPTASTDEPTLGFYALNGESVATCKQDVTKESVGDFFELIREKNPDRPIILICDNFSSHFANYVDDIVDRLNIRRVRLPRYAPDLNPIEQIWNSLKRDLSPLDAPDLDAWHRLITDRFENLAQRLSFAESWIERFLDVQRLCP